MQVLSLEFNAAVRWLKYCKYSVKINPINQLISINANVSLFPLFCKSMHILNIQSISPPIPLKSMSMLSCKCFTIVRNR